MKFNRRFYDSTINFRNISKKRLVISIIIGLISAFTIYSFFYLLREIFRVLSSSYGFNYLPNILSEFERSFYNFFFAAISLIFANSIMISYLFSNSKRVLFKNNFRKNRIISDQTFLNSYFLHWFAKIGLVLGAFSMSGTDYNFLPDYIIPLILLLLVLYLETWKTLSLFLWKKRFKMMFIHFIILFTLSFGMSKLELIDYKLIDENQLKYRPILNLPKSSFTNTTYRDSYLSLDVFLNKENDNELLFGYYSNNLNKSHLDFLDFKLSLREEQQYFASIRLSADKQTKMSVIKSIENQIRDANINNIIYSSSGDNYGKRNTKKGIKIKISPLVLDFELNANIPPIPLPFVEEKISFQDTLKIKIGETIIVNNLVIPNEMLVRRFKNHINKNTAFEYIYNKDTKYQDYLTVLSSHFKAVDLIRKKNQRVKLISKDFRYINRAEFREEEFRLRKEYPIVIIEKIN